MKSQWLLVFVFCGSLCCPPNRCNAQENYASLPDSPAPHLSASVSSAPDAAGSGQDAAPVRPGHDATSEREMTWHSLPRDFAHDQKNIWLVFPSKLARGHYWIPTLAVAGGTAGLIYADPHAMPYFQKHATNLDDFNDVFDAYISTGAVVAVPATLMTAGYIRHDQYAVSTALMAADAYADSAMVNLVIKAITRRERPLDVPPGAPFTGTFFNGGKSPLKGSSFPSGHSTGAFSVAAVVATRYRNHRWVPWAMYSFATVISLSRITTSAHFPSDVFLGAAIGYATARYQVVRPQ
jgi:membrane-associated phospholipid phosphatase